MNKKQEQQTKIYENTNLAESYSGAVTPLTSSFAQDVYEGVYRHFASFMGVSSVDAKKNDSIFSKMVVTIGYHLYYDLDSWYTIVRMLPGYTYNKSFFEQMLGVKADERIESDVQAKVSKPGLIWARIKLFFQAGKIICILIFMPFLVRFFNWRFDNSYRSFVQIELTKLSEAEIIEHYVKVRNRLVKLWRTPIANDFGVMVSAGILRSISSSWGISSGYVASLESRSRAHLATLDPGRELFRLAELCTADANIKQVVLSDEEPSCVFTKLQSLHSEHAFTKGVLKYVSTYGSRVPNELKLETLTLNESPADVIILIRSVIAADQVELSSRLRLAKVEEEYGETIQSMNLIKRGVFLFVHSWARSSIRYREATRLRRSQIFGHARQTFLALGEHLEKRGVIAEGRDIFFLTVTELKTIKDKSSLHTLVQERRQEYDAWSLRTLDHRYETLLSIPELESEIQCKIPQKQIDVPILRGTVASTAGKNEISGETLVVKTFDQSLDYRDKILITTFTDPGWTVVFSLVKAIVVERGGLLSHASIVAREMHIPCIIGVEGAMAKLQSGQQVTLNLESGSIRIDS